MLSDDVGIPRTHPNEVVTLVKALSPHGHLLPVGLSFFSPMPYGRWPIESLKNKVPYSKDFHKVHAISTTTSLTETCQ